MASWWTNRGKYRIGLSGTTGKTFRLILVTTPPASAAAAADINVPNDIVANELSGTGYARKTLANPAMSEDDSGDLAKFDIDDPSTYTAINAGTIAGGWVVERVGGSDDDAADHVWMYLETNDLVTNGGDVTLAIATTGVSSITSS